MAVVFDQPPGLVHYPLSPLEDTAGASDSKTDAWMFALANLASVGYGVATDYVVAKTPTSEKIINGGTVTLSLAAAALSFNMAINPDPQRSPIWRLLGGFFTYVNVVVGLRAAVDFFREDHKLPGFHKLAREILQV